MYKNFFGLRENPFNVNPDPRFLYFTPQTQKALDELTYGIQNRKGLILLTGEVGTGKTTLIKCFRAGESPVLIIDEAQGLSLKSLEEIRLLLNLETASEKLLQIVLAGQPELEDNLKRPELRQLRQRITLRCNTRPLALEESRRYITERLRISGAMG